MPEATGTSGRHELRCFCSRSPLLAVYGIDTDGRLFVHVKIYKQHRIYGEFVVKGGDISLKCRECYRWYRIFIREDSGRPRLVESDKPVELQNSDSTNAGVDADLVV